MKPSPFGLKSGVTKISKPSPFTTASIKTSPFATATKISKPSPFTTANIKISPFSAATITKVSKPSPSTIISENIISPIAPIVTPRKIIINRKSSNIIDDLASDVQELKLEPVNLEHIDVTVRDYTKNSQEIKNVIYPILYEKLDSFVFVDLAYLVEITARAIGYSKSQNDDNIIMKFWNKLLYNFTTNPELNIFDSEYVTKLLENIIYYKIETSPQFIQIIYDYVNKYFDEFSTRDLTTVLYYYYLSDRSLSDEMLDKFSTTIAKKSVSLQHDGIQPNALQLSHISRMLTAFLFYDYIPDHKMLEKILSNIDRNDIGGTYYIGEICRALYTWDYNPGVTVLTKFFHQMNSPTARLNPKDIGYFLLTVGYFNYDLDYYKDYKSLFHNIADSLYKNSGAVSWDSIMNILYGLYYLNLLDKDILGQLARNIVEILSDGPGPIDIEDLIFILKCYSFFDFAPRTHTRANNVTMKTIPIPLVHIVLKSILDYYDNLNSEQLLQIVTAIDNLKYKPQNKQYLLLLAEEIKLQENNFSPTELTNIKQYFQKSGLEY